MEQVTYRQEVIRKLIHLTSLWMPLAIVWLGRPFSLAIFSVLLICLLAVEHARRQEGSWVQRRFDRLFAPMLRSHENGAACAHFTGGLYLLAAACLSVLLFPALIAATALSITILADSAAALVGRRWGRRVIYGHKTAEGSTAFAVTALITGIIAGLLADASPRFFLAAAAAALAAACYEAYAARFPIDDNLGITLVAGTVMLLINAV